MKLLNKKQLTWYGIAGIGPNMLNLMVGSYLCDALMVEGFAVDVNHWTYLGKTLIVAGVWSVLVTIAKIIDGVADIPLGAWTDRLKSKWGRRRPAMLLGIVLMCLSYFMMLVVPQNVEKSILNTIWFFFWLASFYTFYTLTMVTYYATFGEVTANEKDRVYLSNVKSAVDIIYFCLGYALIPAMIGLANIRVLAIISFVLMASMIIPFVLIKEKSTLDKDVEERKANGEESADDDEENPPMLKSLVYSLKNKDFVVWMIVYCVLQFGLQMFLTGFNVYYSGTMGLKGIEVMLCNVAGFAPVPFTLILYNYLNKKKGFKFSFQYSLLIFSIGMLFGVFCREDIMGSHTTVLICGICANFICSFGIGSFFSVSYTIPSQIAVDEKKKTGVSHPAMYFAVQGLFGAVASAISTGLVWVNLKKDHSDSAFWSLLSSTYQVVDNDASRAAGEEIYGAATSSGSGWLFLIVAVSCLAAFGLTFILPKSINNIGKEEKEN